MKLDISRRLESPAQDDNFELAGGLCGLCGRVGSSEGTAGASTTRPLASYGYSRPPARAGADPGGL